MSRFVLLACGVALSLCNVAAADKLVETAEFIAEQIRAEPEIPEQRFSAAFLRQVPASRVVAICQSVHAGYGPVERVRLQSRTGPHSGKFIFNFAKHAMPVTLVIDAASSEITGLLFSPAAPNVASFDELLDRFTDLPGEVSLHLVDQSQQPPRVMLSHAADRPLAIGSTFKLFVLAALLEERTPWRRVVRLREAHRSLPSGAMRTWPSDAPVTVHTLALKMISESDNTATDHLIHLLGREPIEAAQRELGVQSPERNIPFLTTADMFRLKDDPRVRSAFVAADADERRRMLDQTLPEQPLNLAVFDQRRPIAIDRIEWFASTADLCRTMAWFATRDDQHALQILALNPGLQIDEDQLPYAGYKGGGEPGVLNMTWLLKTADNRTLTLSATWNNPDAPLDDAKFFELMQSLLNLLADA